MFELNAETRWILGRPNFTCGSIAASLRALGQDIPRRAEDEQAAVIHWMLSLYEAHGEKWREAGDRVLEHAHRALQLQRRARSGAELTEPELVEQHAKRQSGDA